MCGVSFKVLSPRYLEGLSDDIIEIYSQLETEILQDMARRIARLGRITEATRWQAQMLAEAGGLKKNIARILAKYDKTIIRQVTETFTEALETNTQNDNRIFKAMTGRTVSSPNAQAMLSTIQKCHSDLSRLTLTTAATSQQQFVQQANRVYMDVQSGAFDYNTAMKSAADELSKRGITTVRYENGKPIIRSIESAVRMNILTSINQTAANQTLSNAEELGVERFEVTAHIGARPDHAAWQGCIFTRKELYSICELGTATGLCGINCRHSFYPYFEGMEEHYTGDDLDEMASKTVTYNGEELSRYEGEQKLRGVERKIRQYKRQALTQEAAGADSTQARRRLGEWQAAARDFTKQTGIRRDSAREYVGTPTGKQPKGIKPKNATPKKATDTRGLVDNQKSIARTWLEVYKVQSREVFVLDKPLKSDKIIAKIGGADKTDGSCSSVAFAYCANKAGFDVKDFRGGMSRNVFADRTTISEIARLNGVKSKIEKQYNDFAGVRLLRKEMEIGKEYYLTAGNHAAIVRKTGDLVLEYLELQEDGTLWTNGFKSLTDDVLEKRFGCKRMNTTEKGIKFENTSILIDIESLGKNREFVELMKYINTSESEQLKGQGGGAK